MGATDDQGEFDIDSCILGFMRSSARDRYSSAGIGETDVAPSVPYELPGISREGTAHKRRSQGSKRVHGSRWSRDLQESMRRVVEPEPTPRLAADPFEAELEKMGK